MKVRTLEPADLETSGALLYQVYERTAKAHGYRSPWLDEAEARALLSGHRTAEPERVVIAVEGGAIVGVGAARLRGEVASIGPIAAYVEGRGVGGAILDELLSRVDHSGAQAARLYVEGWNASAYALYAGRGFSVVDVVMHVTREPGPGSSLESARGLEVRPFEGGDLDALARFDHRLSGHERSRDLVESVCLVARRRGEIVGYLGARRFHAMTRLGPAVAVDASDLATLLASALAEAHRPSREDSGAAPMFDPDQPMVGRVSTAAPATSMATLGLGFRITELGILMSRGAPPPARPPQLYSINPEIL